MVGKRVAARALICANTRSMAGWPFITWRSASRLSATSATLVSSCGHAGSSACAT